MRRVPLLGLLRGVAATSSAATPCITIPNTLQQGGTSTIPHTHSSAATVISPPPRRRSLMMRPLLATCSSSTSDAGLSSPSSTTAVAYTTCRMKTTTTGNKNSGCTKKKKAKPVVTKKKQQAAIAASSTGKGKGGAATKKKPEKKTKVVEDGKRRTSAAMPKKKEKTPSTAVRAKRLESDIESNVGDATEVGGVEAELLHATKTTPTTKAKKPTVESSSSPPRVAPAVEQRTRFAMRELMTSYFRQAKRPEDKKRMEKQEAIRQREELMAQMRESSAAAISNIPTWDATIMAPGVAKNENSRFSGGGGGGAAAASPLGGGDGGVLEGRLRTDTGLFDGSDRKNLPLKSDSPSSNKLGADVTLRGSQLAEHDLKAMRLRKHHLSSATDDDDEALEEDREVADEGEERLLPPRDDAGRDDEEEEDVMMVENNTQEVFTGLGGRGTPTKHNETAASFMEEEEEEASPATTHLHHHHNEPYQDHAYHDPFSDDDDDDDEQPMILGREGKAAVVR